MRFSRPEGRLMVLGGAVALAFVACDSDNTPQLRILSPSPGAAITMTAELKVPFVISANDFELKAPTDCGTDTRCGVAYLNIDGDACNQPGKPYNNILGEGKLGQDFVVDGLFQYCSPAQRYGTHNVTISLRTPDGKAVSGEGGSPAAATLSIVTQMP